MNDSEGWSSRLHPTPRQHLDSNHVHPPEMARPDGSGSIEQPEYGPEEVHNVLTPAGEIESVGRFCRGVGPRWTKGVLFGTLGFILIVGIANELR